MGAQFFFSPALWHCESYGNLHSASAACVASAMILFLPSVFNLIIPITRGLIRNQRARRMIMFYDVIFALLMLFAGSSVLRNWLRANPYIFIGYWAGCAWLTLLAVLLALFDLVAVRATWRKEKRRLEAEYFDEPKENPPHGENPPRTRAD